MRRSCSSRRTGLFSQLMPGAGKVRWSHEIFPSPRTTRFNEMEYALPYAKGPDALREIVAAIRSKRINTGFPSSSAAWRRTTSG